MGWAQDTFVAANNSSMNTFVESSTEANAGLQDTVYAVFALANTAGKRSHHPPITSRAQ